MINALMGGEINADEFMQRGCDLVTKIKNDSTITKYTFAG